MFRGCLTAVGLQGRPLWHAAPLGFLKDLPQPLIRPDGTFVRATVGPNPFPIMAYTLTGAPQPLSASCSWAAIALGAGNRLYAITTSNGEIAGPCRAYSLHPGQAGSSMVAVTASGASAWVRSLPALPARTPLPESCQVWALTVDAQRGSIYAATSCTLPGGQPQVLVYALDTQGHLRWMVHHRGDGESARPWTVRAATCGWWTTRNFNASRRREQRAGGPHGRPPPPSIARKPWPSMRKAQPTAVAPLGCCAR